MIFSPPFEGGETFSNLRIYNSSLRLTAMPPRGGVKNHKKMGDNA